VILVLHNFYLPLGVDLQNVLLQKGLELRELSDQLFEVGSHQPSMSVIVV